MKNSTYKNNTFSSNATRLHLLTKNDISYVKLSIQLVPLEEIIRIFPMESKKKSYLSPIQSLDFYLENFHALCKKLKLENDLTELKGILKRDLEPSVINTLQTTSYEALVVTDASKKIIWANNGFHQMTGYSKSFAVGKRPTFLQGEKTSEKTKTEIRQLLKLQKRFTKALVNYRKNGEEYLCHIDVLPLLDENKVVTHFLAMEKELAA